MQQTQLASILMRRRVGNNPAMDPIEHAPDAPRPRRDPPVRPLRRPHHRVELPPRAEAPRAVRGTAGARSPKPEVMLVPCNVNFDTV